MKRSFFFLCLMLLVLIVRFLYYQNNPVFYYYPDTYHYLNRAEEIAAGKPLVNPFRLPLYPLLLKQLLKLDGKISFDQSNIGLVNFQPLIDFQQNITLFASLVFIYIAYSLFGRSWKFNLTLFLFAGNIYIFAWEKNILTESLTTSLLLIYIAAIIKFVKNPSFWLILFASLVSVFLFLLRPIYVFISIALLPIILIHFYFKKYPPSSLHLPLILLFTLLTPLYYALENNRLYHYLGISTVGEHDLFDKVIQYQLNPNSVSSQNPYNKILINCLRGRTPNNSIAINDCIEPLNLGEDLYYTRSAPILGNFAKEVILKQPITYISKSIALLSYTTTVLDHDPFTWISTYSTNSYLTELWKGLYFIYGKIHFLVLSFFVFFPLQLYKFIKKPDKVNTILTILGTTIFYVLIFNTFFVQYEYSRLRSPIEPELLIFCSYYIFQIVDSAIKRVHIRQT